MQHICARMPARQMPITVYNC